MRALRGQARDSRVSSRPSTGRLAATETRLSRRHGDLRRSRRDTELRAATLLSQHQTKQYFRRRRSAVALWKTRFRVFQVAVGNGGKPRDSAHPVTNLAGRLVPVVHRHGSLHSVTPRPARMAWRS